MKIYGPKGVAMDADFLSHTSCCERCRTAQSNLGALCLEGSILWKRDNERRIAPEAVAKDEHIASKERARAAMRYKK
jgi:hypothetical protein